MSTLAPVEYISQVVQRNLSCGLVLYVDLYAIN